jgi:hypothetical protein
VLKCAGCEGSNLRAGSDMSDAMEGCGFGFGGAALVLLLLLLLFSELYITATFVEGEFMVPVRDHPIAVAMLAY